MVYVLLTVLKLLFIDWSSCDELPVPDETGDFRVKAKVSIDDDTIFMDETNIKIKRPELITLVQTDKPIYKPGQTGEIYHTCICYLKDGA